MAEAKANGTTDTRRGYFDVDGSGAMTELIFLLELSGPMADLESDLIDGFNDLIARLREERTDLLVWLWKQGGQCVDMNTRVPITEDSALIEQGCFTHLRTLVEEYRRAHPEEFIHQDNVRGSGCLFGVGGCIHMAQQVYQKALPEDRPMRTMVIIVTDNTKIEPESGDYWTPDRLRELVEQQEKEAGWEFVFLGTNINAKQVAEDVGIPAKNADTFACDAAGVRENFASLSRMTCAFAHTGIIGAGWKTKIGEHLAKHKSGRS